MAVLDPFNLTDSEFDAVMTEIDQELRRLSDQLLGREIGGIALFVRRFRVQIDNRHPLQRRIIDWFVRIYGDRLRLDRDYGQTIALVNDEPCRMQCPMFFGNLPVVCTPSALGVQLKMESPLGRIPVTNLLENGIEGITPDLAARVPQSQCDAILKAYSNIFLAFCGLEAALGSRYGSTDAPYIKEALHDLRTSSESLLGSRPNYGQSKWESLQTVEKVLKSCILEKGAQHQRSHSLPELAANAVQAGVPTIDSALINTIQCSPSVRYDSTLVSKKEAIDAHYAAVRLCGQLAPIVKKTTAEIRVHEFPFSYRNNVVFGCLLLGYGAPVPPRPTAPVAEIRMK
jgi:hypothetical protein